MKTRKVLWLTCVMTCLFVGRSTADETPGRKAGLPRYVSEFLYKLQIRAELISDPIFLNQSVPSAAAKIGLENVHQAAAEAKDGLTGSNYFKIRTIPEGK